MTSPCQLNGQAVLVTRPAEQSARLCELISAVGGSPIAFPTLEIRAEEPATTARRLLAGRWDLMLFVSRNAVEFACQLMSAWPKTPDGDGQPLIGAVGRATAAALRERGLPPELVPEQGFDSEALLALPALRQVAGRRVLIVRGVGGRATLGDILRERGAQVAYAEVYRRSIPETDINALIPQWQDRLGVITATSDEVLKNLCQMVDQRHKQWLHAMPLVVMSDRGGATAMQLGFRTVAVAEETSDAGVVDAVCRLAMSLRPAP